MRSSNDNVFQYPGIGCIELKTLNADGSAVIWELNIVCAPLTIGCQKLLDGLINENVLDLWQKKTEQTTQLWKSKQRVLRITGSRCYKLFTYTRNKNPDWLTKSRKYFYP